MLRSRGMRVGLFAYTLLLRGRRNTTRSFRKAGDYVTITPRLLDACLTERLRAIGFKPIARS
jgi:hypothetical protein